MAEQRQDDQLEPTYNNSLSIRDIALKTCRKPWTREGQGYPCSWCDEMMMMMMIVLRPDFCTSTKNTA